MLQIINLLFSKSACLEVATSSPFTHRTQSRITTRTTTGKRMAIELSSSSSEDIFTRGGIRGYVSMYSQLDSTSNVISSDDSDANDSDAENEPSLLARCEQQRGRAKRKRPNSDESKTKKKQPKKKGSERAQPFADELDSKSDDDGANDGVFDVDADEEEVVAVPRDDADDRVARVLAESRKAVRMLDEEHIIAEAAREGIAAAEREEREECQRKEKEERRLEKAREEATVKKSVPATGPPIILKVRCGTFATKVRTKSSAPLLDVLPRFCQKFGLDAAKAVMQVDGEDVSKGESAIDYDLEDNMVIDVFIR